MKRLDIEGIDSIVRSERLRLEPLRPEHAEALFPMFCQPRVYDWISLRAPASADRLAARWRTLALERTEPRAEYGFGWAVRRELDGAWLGKLDADVRADGVAGNVGYLFDPGYWGQGYASEAVSALARHLERHGVHEQWATVTVGNKASMRVLGRAGFIQTRVLKGNDTIRGVAMDDVEFVRRAADAPG
ncbi:GNAT family N-acetyltransferase [Chromobacterium alticapitis]|uniref:N-acetyltransferase domain-containing protein n=1 Tax=Chromobacterium alticapitis TaxID=2073169 RepID=A0A2S5DHB1_9NEIS|nr:GNAT family N-acetyltransferase [Chromobacterium alticapitis]POZ62401.1 hypothetical protein C2I19_08585 [Chromobacterium alticapitis]